MHAPYAELGKDVYSLSDTLSNDSNILVVSTATFPAPSKVGE